MEDRSCDGCFYAVPAITDDDNLDMECRRFPQQLFVFEGDVWQSFPSADKLCGEYKRDE